jgi:hypothetical protein
MTKISFVSWFPQKCLTNPSKIYLGLCKIPAVITETQVGGGRGVGGSLVEMGEGIEYNQN